AAEARIRSLGARAGADRAGSRLSPRGRRRDHRLNFPPCGPVRPKAVAGTVWGMRLRAPATEYWGVAAVSRLASRRSGSRPRAFARVFHKATRAKGPTA